MLALHASPAAADLGTVAMRVPGCSYYVVALPMGNFALVNWFGGHSPGPGEQLSGVLQAYGMTQLNVGPAGFETSAWVEEFMLGGDAAARKLYERCALRIR